MMKIRTNILLLCVVALCAVTIASPMDKAADSSSEESGETDVKELQETCRNNSGSDAAFFELVESFHSATNCSVAAIDLQGFMLEAKTLSNETRMTFFPRYCPQLRTAYKCSDKLANDLRPCMEKDDFTIMKKFAFTLLHAVEQVCKNDGEILFEFDVPRYTECFEEVSNSFDECLTFLNGSMTRDRCPQLPGFRQCLQDKVKLPNLISVYDLFQNTLFRMTPCRNYVEIEKLKVGLVAMVHCIENTSEK
uniref:Secreted protein n=1 Tax=Anopheles funestus TaxID=62324 RepID=A0A182R6Y1_ANOFN